MKNTYLFLFIILNFVFVDANAQRDYPSQKNIAAFGGIGESSFLFGGGFNQNVSKKLNVGVDAILDFGEYKNIDFTQFHLLPALHYKIAAIERKAYFKLGGGLLLNYSKVNFEVEQNKKPKGFNVGPHVSALADFYLSDDVVVFASWKVGFQVNSFMGRWPYFGVAGIKFTFGN